MRQSRDVLVVSLSTIILMTLVWGCERTIEEEVVQPIEAIYGQKNAASLEAAVSNVRTVRAALMRYPVNSPDNLYPEDVMVYDYETLRETLADENLPLDMIELMWDPAYGIRYVSDGYTFTFEVHALSGGEAITAAPGGVTVSQ